MGWKFVLILSLIAMAIDSSLAKRRKIYRIETLFPACSRCLHDMHSEKSDVSDPADRSQYKPLSVALRRTTKNLSSSCVACIKFLETKRKRMNHYEVNNNRFKIPYGITFRPDYQDFFDAITGMNGTIALYPAPDSRPNVHYHFHISMERDPGSTQSKSRNGEGGSETAQSNFEVIELAANETTQVRGETIQSSSGVTPTGNETTQISGETTQFSSMVTAMDNETAQDSGETTQYGSGVTPTGNETTQVSGETSQYGSVVTATGNETTQMDDGLPNEASALALAVALFVPAPAPFLDSRTNVNYDYD